MARLSQRLGYVTVCLKHRHDVISDGRHVVVVVDPGSPRRCGGQGDVLAGSAGTFFHWTNQFHRARGVVSGECGCEAGASAAEVTLPGVGDCPPSAGLIAAYGACVLTRRCNAQSFATRGRSTTTVDLIDAIGPVFMESFER